MVRHAWSQIQGVFPCCTRLRLTETGVSITASLSTLFVEIYHVNEWQAGLIYLPFAAGGTLATLVAGPLLDGAYRRARSKQGLPTDRIKGDNLDQFPIEKVRVQVMVVPMMVISVCTVAFGWVLQYRGVSSALPRAFDI